MDPESSRSIGAVLREARQRQQLTLAECMERTRIRRKYLEALENEDFQTLPEPAYVRGFLRTYSTSLGVAPQRLIDAYDETVDRADASGERVELRAREAPPGGGRPRARRHTGARGLIWALVGLAAVVVVAFFASRGLAMDMAAASGGVDYFSR